MAVPEDSGLPSSLYRLSPDGVVTELFGGVGLSNGLDWSDDRRVFYYSDSHAGGVDAFDIDPDTGALSGRRRLAEVSGGLSDGLTPGRGGLPLARRLGQQRAAPLHPGRPPRRDREAAGQPG